MTDQLLEVRDVSVRFGGVTAVDHVSFSVGAGEILGVIGPNGAGKSTLFGAIVRAVPITGGSVAFDGIDITGKRPTTVARLGIARTFQKVRLFQSMTVHENILTAAAVRYPGLAAARDKAIEIAEQVGLANSADRLVTSIPLADRKKVEIARALAANPRLLMLDEMMNGLTVAESDSVMSVVEDVRDTGVTVMLVEHVMHVVRRLSDRLLVLQQGKLIADGAPDEVLARPDVREAYLGVVAGEGDA